MHFIGQIINTWPSRTSHLIDHCVKWQLSHLIDYYLMCMSNAFWLVEYHSSHLIDYYICVCQMRFDWLNIGTNQSYLNDSNAFWIFTFQRYIMGSTSSKESVDFDTEELRKETVVTRRKEMKAEIVKDVKKKIDEEEVTKDVKKEIVKEMKELQDVKIQLDRIKPDKNETILLEQTRR